MSREQFPLGFVLAATAPLIAVLITGDISSIPIGRAPTLLRSHWSTASECCNIFLCHKEPTHISEALTKGFLLSGSLWHYMRSKSSEQFSHQVEIPGEMQFWIEIELRHLNNKIISGNDYMLEHKMQKKICDNLANPELNPLCKSVSPGNGDYSLSKIISVIIVIQL